MKQVRLDVTLSDGRRYPELAVTNRAHVEWDLHRNAPAQQWPSGKDAPFLWLTFLAWCQLSYQGDIDRDAVKFRLFRDELCIDIEEAESTEADELDPTTAAGESPSASP